jgi:hypothetical protein
VRVKGEVRKKDLETIYRKKKKGHVEGTQPDISKAQRVKIRVGERYSDRLL